MSLHLKGIRRILVISTQKEDNQKIVMNLAELSRIRCKYVLTDGININRLDRYIEALTEQYPEIYDVWYSDRNELTTTVKTKRLEDQKANILAWIQEAEREGFTVTWHV